MVFENKSIIPGKLLLAPISDCGYKKRCGNVVADPPFIGIFNTLFVLLAF